MQVMPVGALRNSYASVSQAALIRVKAWRNTVYCAITVGSRVYNTKVRICEHVHKLIKRVRFTLWCTHKLELYPSEYFPSIKNAGAGAGQV